MLVQNTLGDGLNGIMSLMGGEGGQATDSGTERAREVA